MRLLAERANQRAPMSDEEYEREIAELERNAVRALSADELCAEIERRRALPAPDERSQPSG